MSFSPKNVAQLLVANVDKTTAFDAATTAKTKAAALPNVGDFAIIKTPAAVPAGSAVTYSVNVSVGLVVKTTNGFKVSEQLNSATQDSFSSAVLAAGVAKKITLTYPAVAASKTYVANIILHDHIGSMLNERFINAYVNVDADTKFINSAGAKVTATLTAVTGELEVQLQASIDRANEGFTITSTATAVIVEGAIPGQKIGAIDGIANPFEFEGGVKGIDVQGNTALFDEAATPVVTTAPKDDGLVQLKNIEWFYSGYDKDSYRDIAWPSSFAADSNIAGAGIAIGDTVGIYQFHKDRDATNVERQHRQLMVAGAGFNVINAALAAEATTA